MPADTRSAAPGPVVGIGTGELRRGGARDTGIVEAHEASDAVARALAAVGAA